MITDRSNATREKIASKVYVGPAGWSYPDWKGTVYPDRTSRDFDALGYLAGYFDVIEINTSFYRPVPREWAKRWIESVADNKRFRFTAKLWRRFTHDRGDPPDRADVAAVREGLDALAEEERLLAVLLQFPWSFRNELDTRTWLAAVVEAFADYPLVLEVRHVSWDESEALDWLKERSIGLAMIDQPLHDGSLKAVDRRTGPVVYHRLHGRNFAEWFAKDRPGHERYNYLYSADELAPWVDRARDAAADDSVSAVISIANNHFRGQAVVNALEILGGVRGERIGVPDTLRDAYPEITRRIAPPTPQRNLFEDG